MVADGGQTDRDGNNAQSGLNCNTYKLLAQGLGKNGIASVQKNCAADANYDRKEASDGRPYFNLKAANHQIIGTSQMYASATNRDVGIESVKTNGVSNTIKDHG